jgi:hypothetical protein
MHVQRLKFDEIVNFFETALLNFYIFTNNNLPLMQISLYLKFYVFF